MLGICSYQTQKAYKSITIRFKRFELCDKTEISTIFGLDAKF